jgi:hypothetical protein
MVTVAAGARCRADRTIAAGVGGGTAPGGVNGSDGPAAPMAPTSNTAEAATVHKLTTNEYGVVSSNAPYSFWPYSFVWEMR